jgi:hypothetical protein
MSRIFDAIRIARESRDQSGVPFSERLEQMELEERRITSRKDLDIDLTVYGRLPSENTFYAQAKAIRGNANGGVFLLSVPVADGQDLLLINNGNSQEQICNVISVRIRDMQTSEVSVSFPVPNAGFWKNS